jgi:uncharacterized phage protein (TIGR02216 family)
MRPEPTPWAPMLAAAAIVGVPPAAFWRLSVKEWRALTARSRHDALNRNEFNALMQTYPDRRHGG